MSNTVKAIRPLNRFPQSPMSDEQSQLFVGLATMTDEFKALEMWKELCDKDNLSKIVDHRFRLVNLDVTPQLKAFVVMIAKNPAVAMLYVHVFLKSPMAAIRLYEIDEGDMIDFFDEIKDDEGEYETACEEFYFFDRDKHAAYDFEESISQIALYSELYFDLDKFPEEPNTAQAAQEDDDEIVEDEDEADEKPARKRKEPPRVRRSVGRKVIKAQHRVIAKTHERGEAVPKMSLEQVVKAMQNEKHCSHNSDSENSWELTRMMRIRDEGQYLPDIFDDLTRFDDVTYVDSKPNWWVGASEIVRGSKIFEVLAAYWKLEVVVETESEPSLEFRVPGLSIFITHAEWRVVFDKEMVSRPIRFGSYHNMELDEVLAKMLGVFDCLPEKELRRLIESLGFLDERTDSVCRGLTRTEFDFGGETLINNFMFGGSEPEEMNMIGDQLIGEFLWFGCDEVRGAVIDNIAADTIDMTLFGVEVEAWRTSDIQIDGMLIPLYTMVLPVAKEMVATLKQYRDDRKEFSRLSGMVMHKNDGNELSLIGQLGDHVFCLYGKIEYN